MTIARVAIEPDDTPPGPATRLVLDDPPTTLDAALGFAPQLGAVAGTPGGGSTRDLWEALATLGSIDLGVVRAVEPHLDALAILREAGVPASGGASVTWGVFAAEGGNEPVRARELDGRWQLSGTKPWCSLAARLDGALITAHLPHGGRGLFTIELTDPGVTVRRDAWPSRGLSEIPSGPVVLAAVAAIPVGGTDWYLSRPGFAWGGIGVAACWYGGAVALARALYEGAGTVPAPILAMHLGRVDAHLQSARRALAEAARLIDRTEVPDAAVMAKRVRAAVATCCESVIVLVGHALGPAPLALDAEHSKRVADLQLYIRQHHAEKDEASLGSTLAEMVVSPW
jgi:alkylation response protein AidB-like acyl-CoA dehydrogenase